MISNILIEFIIVSISEAGNLLKERVAEMEEKLQRQESDLDSHIKAIASLESEKLDLIEGMFLILTYLNFMKK